MNSRRFAMALAALLILLGAAPTGLAQQPGGPVMVQTIALAGPAAEQDAEISGLAWYGNALFLLVENPNIYASAGNAGMFYALHEDDILLYLLAQANGQAPAPLEPLAIPVIAPDIVATVPGFDGFEAVAFSEDRVFLTIEAELADGSMRGYVVAGTIEPDLSAVTLDLENRVELPPQTEFGNMAYESLFVAGDSLVALYEANGAAVNPEPTAYVVDMDLQTTETIPFTHVEYRVTDATTLDADEVFWAINYFFPGVERLVALQYGIDGVTLAERPPIQFYLPGGDPRNWEGVARLGEVGLLVVTDKYPETILGFVPFPAES